LLVLLTAKEFGIREEREKELTKKMAWSWVEPRAGRLTQGHCRTAARGTERLTQGHCRTTDRYTTRPFLLKTWDQ